jgi:hypothetical protein
MWEPRPLTPLWAFTACYRDSFTLEIQLQLQQIQLQLQQIQLQLQQMQLQLQQIQLQLQQMQLQLQQIQLQLQQIPHSIGFILFYILLHSFAMCSRF